MSRTVFHHTLSALATLAFVSAFASSPVSAQQEMEYLKQEKWGVSQEQKTPKGLATQKEPQEPATNGANKPKAPEGLATKKPAPHSGNLLDKPTFGEKF